MAGTRRFKRKFRKKNDKTAEDSNSYRERSYKEIVRENKEFEEYYKLQGLIPEEEWKTFIETLKRDLPTAFRITACSKEEAKRLLEIVQSDIFSGLIEGETGLSPDLKCLDWYPDKLGWQLTISRKDIRRSENYFRLHNFLMAETATGNISRQETVSMIPPLLLDVKPHHKVLDLCAAPGSKTAQIIEKLHDNCTIPDGFVIANDVDNSRCYMLVHQAKRLNSPCFIVTNHDASIMPNFINNNKPVKFDRVLCDVPCSGDGTLRKNADIWNKWNINNANCLHGVQYRILKRGVELLEIGGRLVYSTCSMNPIENEAVINRILYDGKGSLALKEVSDLVPGLKFRNGVKKWQASTKDQERIMEKCGLSKNGEQIEGWIDYNLEKCIRVFPHDGDTGGFFVAVLEKSAALPWEGQDKQDLPEDEIPKKFKEKKRRILGYREDPFVFFEPNEEVWESAKSFYDIQGLDPTCLLTRCKVGKKKNIYFTSKAVKDLVDSNQETIKIINTGVKVLSRCDNKSMKCDFRLVHEGLFRIKDLIKGRRINLPQEDLIILLKNFDPHKPTEICELTEQTKTQAELIGQGSCILDCDGIINASFVGWRGSHSLRVYISRPEAIHYLRIYGVDVSVYDVNKFKKEEKKGDVIEEGSKKLKTEDD